MERSAEQRIRRRKHSLEVDFLFAVRTRLLLTNNAPASDTELMESDRSMLSHKYSM